MLTRRLGQTIRFFSILKDEDILRKYFESKPKSLNFILKEQILLNHLNDAKIQQVATNRLALHDASIPKSWPLSKKLDYAASIREKYPPRPVLTSHPTEILSDEMRRQMDQLVKNILNGREGMTKEIEQQLDAILSQSWLPEENLTPEQEMQRQDDLYLQMMSSWPTFNRENRKQFAEIHECQESAIEVPLTTANQHLYRHVASWAVADIDGNKKRNRRTMETMESGLQSSIITRYLQRLEPLLAVAPSLASAYAYLQRCQESIAHHIYFNVKGAHIAKKRLIFVLNKVMEQPGLEPHHLEQLQLLRDLVALMGFRGDLKQFVRQSSKANAAVFQELVTALSPYFFEIKQLAQEEKIYAQWSSSQKEALHDLLRKDSKYFAKLKQVMSQLSADVHRELDILEFVTEYQDQFSYILSDTENTLSLNEVIILFALAAYRKNKLYIDDIRIPPVNLIPLCETPQDLANLESILDAMLNNPYLKEVIIKNGEIIYVAGPSDLGKEGGLFAHIELIEAEKNANRVLAKHQALDPNLQDVQLRVLYGLGGDFHRRVSQAFSQLFCTFQGSEACALGAYGRFPSYVHQVASYPSENTLRARQLAIFEAQEPHHYQSMKMLIQATIQAYQNFIKHPASQALFRKLTISAQLGALTNTSSRAESKGAAPKDIVQSRAIGIANYDIASLLMMRIIMSADGLLSIPQDQMDFARMYQCSIVVKEQVMKLLFAMSVMDLKRAWHKVLGMAPSQDEIRNWSHEFTDVMIDESLKQPYHALAYMVHRLPDILNRLCLFFPMEQRTVLEAELKCLNLEWSNLSNVAMHCMVLLGKFDNDFKSLALEIEEDLRPRYQRLAMAMKEYERLHRTASPADLKILEENVVLALRGDRRVTAGPKAISDMRVAYDLDLEKVNTEREALTYR